MPQSLHGQSAELHNHATHTREVAAVAPNKADHRSAHELSEQERELSREGQKRSEQLDAAATTAAQEEIKKETKVKPVHVIRPGLPL